MLEKGVVFLLTKIKTNTVNTYFVCEILKILIGNMLNSMKESPTFLPFFAVCNIFCETEI